MLLQENSNPGRKTIDLDAYLTKPFSWACSICFHTVGISGTARRGLWIRYRSMYDTPSYRKSEQLVKDVQYVRTFSKLFASDVGMSRPSEPENLVVMYISSRGRPLWRTAAPASVSFRYAWAVSGKDEGQKVLDAKLVWLTDMIEAERNCLVYLINWSLAISYLPRSVPTPNPIVNYCWILPRVMYDCKYARNTWDQVSYRDLPLEFYLIWIELKGLPSFSLMLAQGMVRVEAVWGQKDKIAATYIIACDCWQPGKPVIGLTMWWTTVTVSHDNEEQHEKIPALRPEEVNLRTTSED